MADRFARLCTLASLWFAALALAIEGVAAWIVATKGITMEKYDERFIAIGALAMGALLFHALGFGSAAVAVLRERRSLPAWALAVWNALPCAALFALGFLGKFLR